MAPSGLPARLATVCLVTALAAGSSLVQLEFVPTASAQSTQVALQGGLERVAVFGKSLDGNLMGETASPSVSIYLPPSYSTEPERRYPVVYMLHGYTNTDLGYFGPDGRQAHLVAERAFASGSAKEMILVMPNCMNAYGGCMYSSSVTAGDWEGYIAEDLVAYLDAHYRTLPRRESRGLAGHSMGGYGTLRIGMKRPDVFAAIYALSSCCLDEGNVQARSERLSLAEAVHTIEGGRDADRSAKGTLARAAAWAPNPDNPPLYLDLPTKSGAIQPQVAVKWAANSPVAMLAQYVPNLMKLDAVALDIGRQDGLITSNEVFVAELSRFGIPHTYETYEGDHSNRVAERIELHVLPFFSEHLAFETAH